MEGYRAHEHHKPPDNVTAHLLQRLIQFNLLQRFFIEWSACTHHDAFAKMVESVIVLGE